MAQLRGRVLDPKYTNLSTDGNSHAIVKFQVFEQTLINPSLGSTRAKESGPGWRVGAEDAAYETFSWENRQFEEC